MQSEREVALETDAQKRFQALWRSAVDGDYPPAEFAAGVTQDGRYAYRYDDQGRFYAAPIRVARVAFDDCPPSTEPR